MSDAVVSFVLENLKNLLLYEANLFLGVKEQVDLLQGDLGFINSFLKDSEGKQNEHYMVKELISQIRDAAFEAEDVLSIYMAHVIKQRRRRNLLQKLFHSFGHATTLHEVANETTRIKKKIDNIYDNKSRFGIEAGSHSHLDEEAERLLERRRDVEEVDVVGFANETTTLVHQLTDGSLQLEVTSIIGMGGLGKTTLARKIYNDSRIKNHFDCCAWVNVSQEYKTRRLLLDMMKCFMSLSDEIHQKSDEELKHTLRDNLKGKRYFVAMDDVWKPEVWDEIKVAFPDESKGSRLLITSREKAVATHASSTPPYFLPFLDKEASWELFCKKVFRGEKCPSYLESLGRQLAESCKGLPLSIVVLGGILANKDKTHQIWSSLAVNVSRFLFEDRNTCFDILALSYNQLPRRLKLCFLYVGVFPEDFEIPVRHLTQLWVAEGFIPVQNGINRKLEEDMGIAELYLAELIDRSLIQVAGRRSDGGVKTCRIHDLLRDFCINVSMEEKLFEVHDADLLSSSSSSSNNTNGSKARRLSFQGNISHSTASATLGSLSVRSVLSFRPIGWYNGVKDWKWILKHLRFIRVLSLEKCDAHSPFIIRKGIEKLIFLRYLRISNSDGWSIYIESIPSSICKLLYLETIHIRGYVKKPLPKSIWMMKQLRHLNVTVGMELSNPWSRTITSLGVDDHALSNLQVLSNLRVGRTTELLITKSSLFPNLRKLHLTGGYCEYYEVSKILASLQGSNNFQNLQTLKLEDLTFGHALDLFPSVLTKITFMNCPLDSDHFKILGKLPNLRILKIEFFEGLHMLSVKAGEFPQLEAFQMIECVGLRTWEMEMDAMPNLQRLVIEECAYLGNLPHQLWSLTHLRLVELSGYVSPELKEELREFKVKDGCKLIIS